MKILVSFERFKNPMVFGFFLVLWFGVLIFTGSLTSGYHFMDDHDLVRLNKELSGTTMANELDVFIGNIIAPKMRFRPFYILHRRLTVLLLGSDFTAWSVYMGMLGVFTAFLLYLFMKSCGFSVLESVFFSLLTLLGEQAAVWWRLGTGETLAMFLFSVSMYCMVKAHQAKSRSMRMFLYGMYIFFIVLATWCKEAFILVIPAQVMMLSWLVYREGGWAAVKKNWFAPVLFLFIGAVELVYVIFSVGTGGTYYAGYDGFSISKFIQTGLEGAASLHAWVILVQLIIVVFFIFKNRGNDVYRIGVSKPWVSYFVFPGVIAILVVIPQVLLYMKSGMTERYLLPAAFGFAFLIVTLLKFTREYSNDIVIGRQQIFSKRLVIYLVTILVGVVVLLQLRITRYTAMGFAQEGKDNNAWFQAIRDNTKERDFIVVVTHPLKYLESSVSFKVYLDYEIKRSNVVFIPGSGTIRETGHSFWGNLNKDFFRRNAVSDFSCNRGGDRKRIQAILIFPGLEKVFLKSAAEWFHPDGYKRIAINGGYVSYFRIEGRE